MPRPSVKEDIVAAARTLLHERGFNSTGVQDITDAAGVPKGSFYNHFDSKEALGVEALERYWQSVMVSLETLKHGDAPALTRLKAYFHGLNEIARKNRYRPGCMIGNFGSEISDQSPLMRDWLAETLKKWTRSIEDCVRAAQKEGSVRRDLDARMAAAFLLNSWEGAVLRSKVDRNASALEAFEKVAFAALVS
jgi:TetR/AcrR family transcriptional repressor of nem operon